MQKKFGGFSNGGRKYLTMHLNLKENKDITK